MLRPDVYILIFLAITTLYGYYTGIYTYLIRITCLVLARMAYPFIGSLIVNLEKPLIEIVKYYGYETIAVLLEKNTALMGNVLYISSFLLTYVFMCMVSRILWKMFIPKKRFSRKINQYLGFALGLIFGLSVVYIIYSGVCILANTGLPFGLEAKKSLDSSCIISVLSFVLGKLGV